MAYRAIAFDLDGTLLDSQKKIRLLNREVICKAQDMGVEVLIATGRHPQAAHYFHHLLGLQSYAICCNGACLYDFEAMKAIISNPLQKNEVEGLYNICRQLDFPIKVYADGAIMYEKADKYIDFFHEWRKHLPEQFQPVLKKIENNESFFTDDPTIWKYTLWEEDISRMTTIAERAEKELDLSCEWWSTAGLDITRSDNTKGLRLLDWAKMRNIDPQEIIVFGDNYNDVSMLSMAGLGVAMGQADDEVKKHADIVAPGDNDSDAIAEVLQKYVLG